VRAAPPQAGLVPVGRSRPRLIGPAGGRRCRGRDPFHIFPVVI